MVDDPRDRNLHKYLNLMRAKNNDLFLFIKVSLCIDSVQIITAYVDQHYNDKHHANSEGQ